VSYKRALCVVWTPPSFATEASVVCKPSGIATEPNVVKTSSNFATCTVRTTGRRMSYMSYGRHQVSRQTPVSYGHHLVFATCTVRTTPRRGIVWTPSGFAKFDVRAQYARRKVVCLRTCTVGRMDAIMFRDVQNTHDVRAYARHRGVVSYERAQCDVWTLSSIATKPSVVCNPTCIATKPSVVGTSSGFATCTVGTSQSRMSYERAQCVACLSSASQLVSR